MNDIRKLPVLCIVDRNTLSAVGLKSIILGVSRQMEVKIFDSVSALESETADEPIMHYFVQSGILMDNLPYFQERRQKTIALVDGATRPEEMGDFHVLHTNQTEQELVRSLLAMMQKAHSHGRNLPHDSEPASKSPLSKREVEVLCLVVRGHINKEIADQLCISLTTVISHRKKITEKLNIHSVSGLTIYAVTHGYVNAEEIIPGKKNITLY